MVNRRLDELKSECRSLGLEVPPQTGRPSKEPFVRTLQKHYLTGTTSKTIQKVLDLKEPMLCFSFNNLREKDIEVITDRTKADIEAKYDGCRIIAVKVDDELDFYSRNLSVENYLPIRYPIVLDRAVRDYLLSFPDFMTDMEVQAINPNIDTRAYTKLGSGGVITENYLSATTVIMALEWDMSIKCQLEQSRLKLFFFDILEYGDYDYKPHPLTERKTALYDIFRHVVDMTEFAIFTPTFPESTSVDDAFDQALKLGYEGIVIKLKNSPYMATKRSRYGWIKKKISISDTHDLDCFITGWEPGEKGKAWENMIGGLFGSVYLKDDDGNLEQHEIARVINFTDEFRKSISKYDEAGTLYIEPSMMNQVMTVDGQCITARSKRIRHAKLVRFRPDKSPDNCVIDKKFLTENQM